MTRPTTLVSLLAVTAALTLGGCTSPEPTVPRNGGPDYDEDSYTLEAVAVPAAVKANQAFNFTLQVIGHDGFSDHIGAHYGPNSTDEPSIDVYTGICTHQASDLPGDFTVQCTIQDEGDHYLRGHTRVTTDDGRMINYWTVEEFTILVGPDVG